MHLILNRISTASQGNNSKLSATRIKFPLKSPMLLWLMFSTLFPLYVFFFLLFFFLFFSCSTPLHLFTLTSFVTIRFYLFNIFLFWLESRWSNRDKTSKLKILSSFLLPQVQGIKELFLVPSESLIESPAKSQVVSISISHITPRPAQNMIAVKKNEFETLQTLTKRRRKYQYSR